ncbi:MAG: hypothetical protein GDA53_04580 [Rhodobacteraceae bacterium]|nr:hypothetical protein [Paracoccaceae bacterium]
MTTEQMISDKTARTDGGRILLGCASRDVPEGGTGTDTAGYAGLDEGVRVNLSVGFVVGGHAEGGALRKIENQRGSGSAAMGGCFGDDTLAGGAGANLFPVGLDVPDKDVIVDFAIGAGWPVRFNDMSPSGRHTARDDGTCSTIVGWGAAGVPLQGVACSGWQTLYDARAEALLPGPQSGYPYCSGVRPEGAWAL